MANVGNWVSESCSTVGTGPLVLTGGYQGQVTFAKAFTAEPVHYSIIDGANRECGTGDFDGTTGIARTSITATYYNGVYDDTAPTPIPLSGASIVSCTYNASTFDAQAADAAAANAAMVAAEAALDSFDDRYLGAKATPPTLDNDGAALLTGAMYFDTNINLMRVYTGSAWVATGSVVEGVVFDYEYTATGGQTVFNGVYDTGAVYVYVNGILLADSDYTADTGTTVVMSVGLNAGDIVKIISLATFEVADAYTKAEVDYIVTTTATAATISDLLALDETIVKSALVVDYHSDVKGGGGRFVWDATAVKNTHNGGTIIDPDVTYPTDWTNQAQLTTWFDGSANVTTGCWIRKYDGDINPRMFGAKGGGTTNDSLAIAEAFAASPIISFTAGSYLMVTGVTKIADDIDVDFGNATIINGGAGFTFTFGATADTPTNSGLRVTGGNFIQLDPNTASNLNYIRIAGMSDFNITKCKMKNVSNGGIYVEAGCEDGLIDGVRIKGKTLYSTCRGIWLNGSTASDYASQLIDISSITRNATPVPVYSVKSVSVTNCHIALPAYGIYNMNTRDTHVMNNYVDVSGGGARCLAINNYSPGAIVKGNTFKGDQSSTGVLVTQYSHDVIISGNTFLGTFGGGRDIYAAYLADCQISGNRFNTDSSQNIQIDMGGTAVIKGNYFNRVSGYLSSARCVYMHAIDAAVAGTSTYGNTATTLPGITFADNVVKNRLSVVNVIANTAQNGNIPGLATVTVRDNILHNFDLSTTSDEYGLKLTAPGTTYVIEAAYFDNTMYPVANAGRNQVNATGGSGYSIVRSDFQSAKIRCVSPAGGGAFTGTKTYGGNFSCSGTSVAITDIATISPRTLAGAAGAAVATPIEIADVNGTFSSYTMTANGTNYNVKFYDAAGVLIDLGTTAVTFDIVIAGHAL